MRLLICQLRGMLGHQIEIKKKEFDYSTSLVNHLRHSPGTHSSSSSRQPPSMNSWSGVVEAVAAAEEALEECCKLARMCVDLSYSGKLLMQSDLDVVLGKLDGHVKVLSRVLSCEGVMSQQAIIVVRPRLGACRDDLRFYVRDLLCRMKIGDVVMKRQALVLLNEAMVEEEKYVKVVVEDEYVVNVLVKILDSSEAVVQEECAKVVCLIAGFDKCRSVLIGGGAVGPLIRILESGSELGFASRRHNLLKVLSKRRTWVCLFIIVYGLLLSSSWNLLQSILTWYRSSASSPAGSGPWQAVYASLMLGVMFGLISMAAALAVALPSMLITWITILVLLTFCGKPRRVLVVEVDTFRVNCEQIRGSGSDHDSEFFLISIW